MDINTEKFTTDMVIKDECSEVFDGMDEKLNNSNVIKNISFDQSEILWNIMQLYNDGNPFDCDMTASELKFYNGGKGQKYVIPEPKILFDVSPTQDKIKKITPFQPLPLEDNSIHSIVVDLPFVISVGPSMNQDIKGQNIISNRFSAFYPYGSLVKNYFFWIKECYRVLDEGGCLIFKTQRTITGSKTLNSPEMSWMFAESVGFDTVDEFYLNSKNRLISGKVKKQQHSRSYVSSFYVFKKSRKKKIFYLDPFDEEIREEIVNGLLRNNVKGK